MRATRALVVAVLALASASACGGSGSSAAGTASSAGSGAGAASSTERAATRPPLPEGRVEDGCFVTDSAPPPLACETDGDCTSGGLLSADTCCMSGVTHTHSRAYHEWQSALFAAHCDTACRQPPSPPLDCETETRCDAGRCVNACSAVPLSDSALDSMDRGELETLCAGGSTAACDRLGH